MNKKELEKINQYTTGRYEKPSTDIPVFQIMVVQLPWKVVNTKMGKMQ